MANLSEITAGSLVRGIIPNTVVTIIEVKRHGDSIIEVTYKTDDGYLGNELIFQDRAKTLEVISKKHKWNFNGDGKLFRLVSEAYRIRLAHLFDPYLAIHTSNVEPLPHQITAVYGEMLPRQPLRFLLADDPGAGKTIMAGLFIKELMLRGDLKRCLIVCPGSLVEQWADELKSKFDIQFGILTNDFLNSCFGKNPFEQMPLCIARLDKLSRDEELQKLLKNTDWDLIVCDEAHKMSASFFGGEIKYTKRYHLGRLLSKITRHFLLLTATPHNGKEADFQLFMALLDSDRFEGRFRDGVHKVDISDMMRRLVKEELLTFDQKPLFPERVAHTINYPLSDEEAVLYKKVTDYVREEFNRADALTDEGRRGTVGFALTILQRRLASSPEAIYQSLKRRRERLERRLEEERLNKHESEIIRNKIKSKFLTEDEIDEFDDFPYEEIERMEERITDQATAAQTVTELEAEIQRLKELEQIALFVRNSGKDRKWEELSKLLQNTPEMYDKEGNRRKLVIFTEHRDTLNYLADKIRSLLGKNESVVTIHGGMTREERKKAEIAFKHDKDVTVLIATDAAGEGINLQRAHLMVNYDLPWNPNRLEQRFGRIHRIGQKEVCHLWNLVAGETREGEVLHTLLRKLEEESKALQGRVFNVLGKIKFDGQPLRNLLVEAIRYGEKPEVKERLNKVIENALDHEYLKSLIEEKALAKNTMDISKVIEIKEEMERIEARKLQPHFISSFFIEAFKHLGGSIREREQGRYEITRVPSSIRNRDRVIGRSETIPQRYERICFEKSLINVPSKPDAEFICPGHPLLDSTIDVILEKYRYLLKQGTILIDPNDYGEQPRLLFYIEHAIQDGFRIDSEGNRRIVSQRLQFVEIDKNQNVVSAGDAPYLDYQFLEEKDYNLIKPLLTESWLNDDIENIASSYAIQHLVPLHYLEVKKQKEELVNKIRNAVIDRLTKEINYWDRRAEELKLQERAGKMNAKINSAKARQRADELQDRLKKRLEQLNRELELSPKPPQIIGGSLVIPIGLLRKLKGNQAEHEIGIFSANRKEIEIAAMNAVMETEIKLGYLPKDVSDKKIGFDIESKIPGTGKLRFIEVKGRVKGATTVTVTKNEILTALNKPDDFILAIVLIDGDETEVYYVKHPFKREPDFYATSINYDLNELIKNGICMKLDRSDSFETNKEKAN